MQNTIQITDLDYNRLNGMINNMRKSNQKVYNDLLFLESELERAERTNPSSITSEFVTMNSVIEVSDCDTNKTMELRLVYPKEANFKLGKISVLSPLGTALLGYKVGSEISYAVPKGVKKMKISKIVYQPEANGEFAL
ncbi:nucleoside diphosphate kinase regulator [Draconibacterium sp.]|jgi:regulator of nucleoside diphosphate kinase